MIAIYHSHLGSRLGFADGSGFVGACVPEVRPAGGLVGDGYPIVACLLEAIFGRVVTFEFRETGEGYRT